MKKNETNICMNLYNELILDIEKSELIQAHDILSINRGGEDDIARLVILDPFPMEIGNMTLFRVSRVITSIYEPIINYNINLRDRGINIFCSWDYDIDDQIYRIYFYNSYIGEEYCPISGRDLYNKICNATIEHIQEDKREEFIKFKKFLIDFDKLISRMRKHRIDRRIKREKKEDEEYGQ